MKSYDETVKDVFRRIDDYKTARKRKRKLIAKTVTGFCLVCLITVLGIYFGNTSFLPFAGDKSADLHAGSLIPDEKNLYSDPSGVVINEPSRLPGDDSPGGSEDSEAPAQSSKPVVRFYPSVTAERTRPPENGEVRITSPLGKAMAEYGDSVVYEIEVYLIKNAEIYVTDEAEWLREYQRISEKMKNEHLAFSTYRDGDGDVHHLLLGIVSREGIENFPADDHYGYYMQLSGDRVGDCAAEEPTFSVINGRASRN